MSSRTRYLRGLHSGMERGDLRPALVHLFRSPGPVTDSILF
jgi:hypothetical protein